MIGKCEVCGEESDDLTKCCGYARCTRCFNAHVELGLYEDHEDE